MPAIALGLSIRTSAPWQALHAELQTSSNHPRNFEFASFKKLNVNMPCSTQILINSAGFPSTGAKSIPCFLTQGSNSACVAIRGLWPSLSSSLHNEMYGCTSPLDPIVRHTIFIGSDGLKSTIDANPSSNMSGIRSWSARKIWDAVMGAFFSVP